MRALASRGRRANPVLTYETALRRFFAYGGVSRRWRNPMMMADDVDAQSDDDGGRWGRQPQKDGWIIVAPGWLAYLGLVVEGGIYRRRAVVEIICKSGDDIYNRSSAVDV